MNHRSPVTALVTAGLVALALLQTPPSLAGPQDASASTRHDPVVDALDRLRGDAEPSVRVHRDATGAVDLVRSPDGSTLVPAPAEAAERPQAAAREYLKRYGAAFHLDGTSSTAVSLSARPAATGGSVVRAEQWVDGLPVFGGDVVMSLDSDGGLVSVAAATTAVSSVGSSTVTVDRARDAAVAVTAKAHRLPPATLTATDLGRWLYDPALIGDQDPMGARPVWRFEVSDGARVRELVLVDAERGSIVLHFNQTAELDRAVCDRDNLAQTASTTDVPTCSSPARGEATGPTGNVDVDAAFDNIGRTSDTYQQVAGIDLGELIGTGTAGSRKLQSWVRWCFTDEPCPMQNAFWDGSKMVLGEGYAAADDVVAHELTHGVIDRTSQLFYQHQSGAINEHLADVLGEITDQRDASAGEDDAAWELGEDVPGGAIRSMRDPSLFGQPDRMTSPSYGGGDVFVDGGEVHRNSGVGNKAAYLISQGGQFNGVTVAGIDSGDPTLTKTATLYLDVMQRLVSGAEYADLGRVLVATCDELAAAGAVGFTASDCDSVRGAVAATEMALPPVAPGAAASEVPDTCPDGEVKVSLFRDDDGTGNTWSRANETLWVGAPNGTYGIPRYASSGTKSWFAFDPDPANYGDPSISDLAPSVPVTVPEGQPTYLHFHHAYVLEWYDATDTQPARYPNGAQVLMLTRSPSGTWPIDSTPLTWVNGPDKTIGGSYKGFGGDSHGYGSSRVDLSPLAGRSVRPMWRIRGDSSGSFMGWFVDDIEIYTCRSPLPTAARTVGATGTVGGATVSWTEPEWPGTGISGYRVTRSDGLVRDLPAEARSTTFTTLPSGRKVSFTVAALNASGAEGPAVTKTVRKTTLTAKASSTRVSSTSDFKMSGQLTRAGTTRGVAGQPVLFQKRGLRSSTWETIVSRTTRSDGTVAVRLGVQKSAYYRLVFPGAGGWVGSRSTGIKITVY